MSVTKIASCIRHADSICGLAVVQHKKLPLIGVTEINNNYSSWIHLKNKNISADEGQH